MFTLQSKIGEEISALVPFFDPKILQTLKLHAVEDAGIWVENQKLTNQILSVAGVSASPKTAIFFLPWQQIVTIVGSLDVPGLSEKQLGV